MILASVIQRGCTSDQWGLPAPLPTQGCYTWTARSQLWCLCSTDGCNGVRMGKASNMTLEQFAEEAKSNNSARDGYSVDTVLPPYMVTGEGPRRVLQCWECQSYYQGYYYSQCPLHDQVDVTRTYIGNCTGRCVMHNALDSDHEVEVMHRGCSSSLYGLPDPLPADGCYSWHHGQVWCICSVTGCNGVQLGVPGERFDAHISSNGHFLHATSIFVITALLLIYF
ncbi:uncharacterized protein LOC143294358 [Babylonia areolata]|uniref:uncharacterized protein LOC143294358 n=1 Tax=Babylonia areolata TaxID=304850 RepID=UPI003FCFDFE0